MAREPTCNYFTPLNNKRIKIGTRLNHDFISVYVRATGWREQIPLITPENENLMSDDIGTIVYFDVASAMVIIFVSLGRLVQSQPKR